MRNRTYGGGRGRKTKVGEKLLRFPPTRFADACLMADFYSIFLEKFGELQWGVGYLLTDR